MYFVFSSLDSQIIFAYALFSMASRDSAILNNPSPSTGPRNEVASVRKALEILCQFGAASASLSVSDLSRSMSLPKSTTHNLLRTLQTFDFVKQDPTDRRYRLGPRVLELGLRFSHSTRLVSLAEPHMRRLADQTKETVKLGIFSDREVLILAAIESPYQLHTRGDEGMRAPLHSTALGKAILTELGTNEVREIIHSSHLFRRTPHSITNADRLIQELETIRNQGYALDVEENETGVVCAASGVADFAHSTVAALSVSAPASRVDPQQLLKCASLVSECARGISSILRQTDAARSLPSNRFKENY